MFTDKSNKRLGSLSERMIDNTSYKEIHTLSYFKLE